MVDFRRTAWVSSLMSASRRSWHQVTEDSFTPTRPAFGAGWQIGTHANSDLAIDVILRVCAATKRILDPCAFADRALHDHQSGSGAASGAGVVPTPFSSCVVWRKDEGVRAGASIRCSLRSFSCGHSHDHVVDYLPGPFSR
jgi:hypothetical protein